MKLVQEHRSVDLVDAEVKGRQFRGLAAVFDSPWNSLLTEATGYVEVVKRGAFRRALQARENVPFLLEHDPHQLLGTTQSGNVKISEDAKGLLVTATLPENPVAEYARSLIEAGDMRGMSYGIALDPQKDVMTVKEGGQWKKLVVNARRLLDVSLTWQPAYTATEVSLRSTGFVAAPLQEYLVGEESQSEEAAKAETPGDQEAWWEPEEDPAEATTSEPIPYWERFARQIEQEY